MKFEVTILGSSSATPVHNRNQTSQLLNCNEHFYLIDCGEGTQNQLIKYGFRSSKIDHIFISHLHGDHFFGLVGILSSLHLMGRTKPMSIYGPKGLKDILDIQFRYSETELRFPIHFIETDTNKSKVILANNDVIVETIILNHRIPCTGFKFTEKKRYRKLLQEKLDENHIPVSYYQLLKQGVDVVLPNGKVLKNIDYTIDSPVPKSYCYCSDTKLDTSYFPIIQNTNLLYHEATFMHDMLERAEETHHTTARQAAEIALQVNAKSLLIGHFSSRYKNLDELFEEAKLVFKSTQLALEGKTFQI